MKHGLSLPEQAPPSPPPLPLPCLPVCWPGCCCPRTLSLSLSPPILLWACQPARQASGREARGGQAGRKKRGGRPAALPLSLPLPPPLASCLLVVYSASLLPSPLPPSVVVVLYWRKMRGWPGPLSSPSSPSQAKQQTFGHRIGRRIACLSFPILLPH